MPVLLELFNPLDVPGAVLHGLTALILQLSKLTLPVRNPAVIARMELFVFLAANHTVRHIRIQVDFQILIPLDFIFQRRHLGVIVDDAPLLFRQRRNVIQHLFHLGDQLNVVVHHPEHDGFQLVLAECMRGTALARFVGGTNQIMILFPAAGDGLSHHGVFAVAAEHEAGEKMNLFLLRRCADIPQHEILNGIKIRPADNGLMVVFNDDPLIPVIFHALFDFVVRSAGFMLNQRSDIDFIGQDSLHQHGAPLRLLVAAESAGVVEALRLLVFHGTQDAHTVESVGDG